MKKLLIILGLLVVLSSFVISHSLYLFDIKLDFDKNLETNVIKSAQDFMKTDKKPLSFDLDKGLIIVHFEEDNNNYVRINPSDFKVYGMMNENLRHKDGNIKFTKEQGYEIAKKLYDTFPKEITSELVYSSDVSEVSGTYYYKWFRYKDGILVIDDDLYIIVDGVNGNIIGYRIPIFYVSKNEMKTNPAITLNVARRVAEIDANAPSVANFQPYLVIYGKKLVWVNKIQGSLYPYYSGVDASDGSFAFMGLVPGEIPQGYNKGKDVPVIETELIKQIYST